MELGLDLNYPHKYKVSSMRYFAENERHVTRTPTFNVLLIMFKGVLKFSENGERVEVGGWRVLYSKAQYGANCSRAQRKTRILLY